MMPVNTGVEVWISFGQELTDIGELSPSGLSSPVPASTGKKLR